jgi:hypothetical protein
MSADFDSEQRILSPARRARRSILALIIIMLLVVGSSVGSDWAQDNVFLTSGPDGKSSLYYHPPFSTPGTVVALLGPTPSNLTQAGMKGIASTFESATGKQIR